MTIVGFLFFLNRMVPITLSRSVISNFKIVGLLASWLFTPSNSCSKHNLAVAPAC